MIKDKLEELFNLYKQSLYKDIKTSKLIKFELNSLIKENFSNILTSNNPTDNKKIAIVIDKLSQEKSLYKEIYPFIESLFREYELTLILLGKWNNHSADLEFRSKVNQHIFKNKIYINDISEFEKLSDSDFSLAYFLTHSQNLAATIMANLRIAPIQITGYGNPVSSYGDEFDYFIGGELIEDIDKIIENYTEKVVLLPQLGLMPSFQEYELKNPIITKSQPTKEDEKFVIGCSCSIEQANFNYLETIKKITSLAKKTLKFIFFCSCNEIHNKIAESLDENIFSIVKYSKSEIEFNHYIHLSNILLDSSFFSDYKLSVKALSLGKPVITLEGELAANRITSGILKKLDFSELIANRENSFLVKVIKLINDDIYREKISKKIQDTDLKEQIFDTSEFRYFKNTIAYLIENHNGLKNFRQPLIINEIFEKIVNAQIESNKLSKDLLNLFTKNEYEKLSELLITKIEYFAYDINYDSKENLISLNCFIRTFLEIFIKPEFIIPESHILFYIKLNVVVANLIFLADLDSDIFLLEVLNNQFQDIDFLTKNQFIKVLTLFSMRNQIRINYKELFAYDPDLSSVWYWRSFLIDNFANKECFINMKQHIESIITIENKIKYKDIIGYTFFSTTYGSDIYDRTLKANINKFIQEKYQAENNFNPLSNFVLSDKPVKNKIAVISSLFYPEHSVHRGVFKFIEQLKDDYELHLICPGEYPKGMDISLFKKVVQLNIDSDDFDLSVIDNDFALIFYPDIGMSKKSMYLANKRLAPIQVTGHGHSVSSFGSMMDYFISGVDSEISENADKNYSERLVLIPGIGLHPTYPSYIPGKVKKTDNRFLIACPWTSRKINYQQLINLKEIQDESNKKVFFRFFPGLVESSFLFSLKKDIENILGQNSFEVIKATNTEYMPLFEDCDIAIDSYHFGGFNTIVDALYLNKPVITLEGGKAYNRFAGGMLKKLGLAELVTTTEQQYINNVLKMINDDNYRNLISNKIENINLKGKLFESDETQYFKKAIAYLIENHQSLKHENSRTPIIIE